MTAALPRLLRPLAVALLLCGVPATAQEKHNIRLNASAGQSWEFVHVVDSTMDIKSSAQGQVQNMQNGMAQRRTGMVTVKEVAGGRPSAITVAFGKDCSSTMKMNGQEQNPPFPLAGQTVTLKLTGDGNFSHDARGPVDPATEAELRQTIDFDVSMYPREAVGIGQEWTPEAAKLKEQLQLAPDDKLDVKCKLLAVGSVKGLKTYDIGITGSVAKNQDGMQMTIRIGGVLQVDTVSGLPIQSDVIVSIGVNGNQQVPGADGQPIAVAVNGNGQIKINGATTPKEGFVAGVAQVNDGPAPVQPDPVKPRPNPLDQDPNGPKPRNPLAMAEESPFAGSFKGKQLSADFKVAGGKVTGAILLGNRSFPAVGTIDAGKLTGSFEADGAKFDFVATLEGTTLNLDSEGNKYVLQKDAAAKPKNPLE